MTSVDVHRLYDSWLQYLSESKLCGNALYNLHEKEGIKLTINDSEVINTALAPPYSDSSKLQFQKIVEPSSLL